MSRPIIVGSFLAFTLVALAPSGSEAKDTPKASEARKKLQKKVTVDYADAPLQDVVDDLKTQIAGLGIRLDTAGGVSKNVRVTYKAAEKPLTEVLDAMFKKNALGYVVVSKEGDAYDGTILIKQGTERGYAAGQEPEKASSKNKAKSEGDRPIRRAKGREKPAPAEKAESPEKPAAKEKPADKPVDKPEDDEEKAERDANRKLDFAKTLANEGKIPRAKQRLEDIIAKYPKTKAAQQAKDLLKDLEK